MNMLPWIRDCCPTTLGDLLHSTRSTPNTEANNPLRLDLDPQAYLRKGNTTNNYRPIVNYIPRAANCEEEEVEIAAGVSIKLKSSAKTKLENVTPAQWTVANARILAELLDDTPASDTKRVTLDYLSHTAKMGELATRYTWSSVILLDDEYRRQQAAYGFRWGSDTPHMSMLVLREREKQKKQASEISHQTTRESSVPHVQQWKNLYLREGM